MSPWLSVVLFGLAVFGFSWLMPKRTEEADGLGSDPAYDRLLEELESENRELLDAVSQFKQEQDNTVKGLVQQISRLESQIKAVGEQNAVGNPAAAAATAASSFAGPSAVSADLPAEADGSAGPAKEPATSAPVGGSSAAEQHPSAAEAAPAVPASIRERYSELLALHQKGRSVEQIAKAVGMNKGEVQLILQLARREEEQFA